VYIGQHSHHCVCTQGKSIGELIGNILDAATLAFLDELETGETVSIVATS
jgi:predicted RNase H-like HicB family nuclease